MVVGQAVLLSVGVRVGVTPTHLVPFCSFRRPSSASANQEQEDSTTPTSSTKPKPPSSSFGRLKAQQVKALIHRNKQHQRPSLQDEDDADDRRFRGWGDTDPTPTPTPTPNPHSHSQNQHQHRKPKSPVLPVLDNNFFSLNSFKDIGCSDNILQSLQTQSLTRPSHIQVIDST